MDKELIGRLQDVLETWGVNMAPSTKRTLTDAIAAFTAQDYLSLNNDALCDIEFRRGIQLGWNLGVAGDHAEMAKVMNSRQEEALSVLSELKSKRPTTAQERPRLPVEWTVNADGLHHVVVSRLHPWAYCRFPKDSSVGMFLSAFLEPTAEKVCEHVWAVREDKWECMFCGENRDILLTQQPAPENETLVGLRASLTDEEVRTAIAIRNLRDAFFATGGVVCHTGGKS